MLPSSQFLHLIWMGGGWYPERNIIGSGTIHHPPPPIRAIVRCPAAQWRHTQLGDGWGADLATEGTERRVGAG